MKRLSVASLTVAAALVLSACSGTSPSAGDGDAEGQSYNWKMTINVGDQSSWYLGAETFAEALEQESGGRMKVTIFPNEQLSGGDTPAGIQQLIDGHKDLSYNSTIDYAMVIPEFGAINAPFLFANEEEADKVTSGTGAEAYSALAAEHGVEFLGFGEAGFRQLTTNKTAVKTPEDLKNLKVRVPTIALFVDTLQALGANATSMPFAEVFTALGQGTIEGQENPIDIIHSSGLAEVQDYLTMWNYVYDPIMLGMNKELFDSLSADDQEIVRKASEAANEAQKQANRDREAEQLAELAEEVEIIELTPEQISAFQEAIAPIYNQYESVWGEDLFTKVQP
ncbi:DctP family TRAP transporter solute-binding subunit [Leucobacter chinensis]|uniref:DctP family TRAP transporter solute-binding subunit n=1 Tax=Leucobacter chinensis TaxID=2851010 RepID=UPI001C22F138|nr:DctP family TRAP transporter solute-binding subunit [Leucobacter chinensis]